MNQINLIVPKSLREVREQYKKLEDKECFSSSEYEILGNKILDYYFMKYRLKTKTKKNKSFYDAIRDPKLSNFLLKKGRHYANQEGKKLSEKDKVRLQYMAFRLYFGTVNQFRPLVAREIYCIFKPKSILDISAGWGGRALAALSLKIPYVGIDTNDNLKKPYERMVRDLGGQDYIRIIFSQAESVNYREITYDFVFTSPPYFMLEHYEKMPVYKSKSDFLEIYFKPTILNVWTNLPNGKYMVLNMPQEMADSLKGIIPEPVDIWELSIKDRHSRFAVSGKVDTTGSTEPIFIYRKGKQYMEREKRKQWKKMKTGWILGRE
jgi:16S rRNA G966 N2-methylase RsmD